MRRLGRVWWSSGSLPVIQKMKAYAHHAVRGNPSGRQTLARMRVEITEEEKSILHYISRLLEAEVTSGGQWMRGVEGRGAVA